MHTRSFAAMVIGLVVSGTALADEGMDPAVLGNFDGMLAVCRDVNPAGKQAYDTLRAAMLGEQPEAALTALAETPEYKQAFQAAHEQTMAEAHDSARQDCASLVGSFGPRAHSVAKSTRNSATQAAGGKGAPGAKKSNSASSPAHPTKPTRPTKPVSPTSPANSTSE